MSTLAETLEQVERSVAQLSPQDQLKLISRISDRLSSALNNESAEGPQCDLSDEEEREQKEYEERIESFLKISEEMAAESILPVDSVETLRQIREERMSRF